MKKCLSCGCENSGDARFCIKCGVGLPDDAQIKKCPSCGKDNPADNSFCQFCGSSMDGVTEKITRRCAECGAELADSDLFCTKCGKSASADKARGTKRPQSASASAEKKKKIKKAAKTAGIISGSLAAAAAAVFLSVKIIIPEINYTKAGKLFEDGKYEDAIKIFREIGDYKDSGSMINMCNEKLKELKLLEEKYNAALSLKESGKYDVAAEEFNNIKDYKDSREQIEEIKNLVLEEKYNEALSLKDEKKYAKAIEIFSEIKNYKDSKEQISDSENQIKEEKYQKALSYIDDKNYDSASALFKELSGYKDSREQLKNINEYKYNDAEYYYKQANYSRAEAIFSELGKYKDSAERAKECAAADEYEFAVRLIQNGNYDAAAERLEKLGDYKDCKKLLEDCEKRIPSYKRLYKKLLREKPDKYKSDNVKFALLHLDSDGIPELFVYDDSFTVYDIYSVDNNELVTLAENLCCMRDTSVFESVNATNIYIVGETIVCLARVDRYESDLFYQKKGNSLVRVLEASTAWDDLYYQYRYYINGNEVTLYESEDATFEYYYKATTKELNGYPITESNISSFIK